ncbi:MAG: UbiX family flavin prenyltransferase [Planctomycetota bacterium]|jgi:4-hydroxy-3-polyprenylbenzoate decarboxylase
MSDGSRLPLVLAVTGASGAAYGVRLLQQLCLAGTEVHFLISPSGEAVLSQELRIELTEGRDRLLPLFRYAWPEPARSSASPPGESMRRWTPLNESEIEHALDRTREHHYRDYMTPIASGSFLTRGMVICPCSGATLSGIVHAAGNNLIQRAADVHLKEHRKLILVPRETPMSVFQLENMLRASKAGVLVMPAMPGWYHGVSTPVDLIDFVVARILDQLQIPHALMSRWAVDPVECLPEHARTGDE